MVAAHLAKRVVVFRHSGLGDFISSLAVLRGIREYFKTSELLLSCPPAAVPLASRLVLADQLLTSDQYQGHELDEQSVRDCESRLTPESLAIILRVPEPALIDRLRNIGCAVLGYQHPQSPHTGDWPAFTFAEHISRRWARLIQTLGVYEQQVSPPATERPKSLGTDYALVQVGSGSVYRRWPDHYWSQILEDLADRGIEPVVVGNAYEKEQGDEVIALSGLQGVNNLCGETSSLDLVGLTSHARVVLSVDSAFAQYAFWVKTASVTIFATVRPSWWGPVVPSDKHQCLWTGSIGDPYSRTDCLPMEKISKEAVITALDRALEGKKNGNEA